MVRATVKIVFSILLPLWLLGLPGKGYAQETVEDNVTEKDTATVIVSDSLTQAVIKAADSAAIVKVPPIPKAAFKPSSTKAILFGLVPGMGQIYNRAYWKLPIVYGGFMGFLYAVTWNNRNYQTYWDGYKAIMLDATAYAAAIEANGGEVPANFQFNKDWVDIWSSESTAATDVNNSNLQNTIKRGKDFYRRNRDLSIILMVGFYFLTIVDAYVDAELFDFDISPELSMRLEPMVSPQTRLTPRTVGLNCSITF